MSFGPVTISTITPQDVVAPGAVALRAIQEGNTKIRVEVDLPTTDTDGGPLSGLYLLSIGLRLRNTDGTNPFTGATGEQIGSIASTGGQHKIVDLVPQDAGTTKTVFFDVIELDSEHIFAASVDDSAV